MGQVELTLLTILLRMALKKNLVGLFPVFFGYVNNIDEFKEVTLPLVRTELHSIKKRAAEATREFKESICHREPTL